jgi:hypothetical protein
MVPQLEPGHRLPATPPPSPPRRQARHHLKPATAFRIPVSRVQLRHLRAAAIGDLHADKAVPGPDRDRDRPARSARGCARTLLPNSSLTSRAASSPHGCPGPSTAPTNVRAIRPLRPPGHRHALPNLGPSHQRTRFRGRPPPANHRGARPDVRDARSTQPCMSSRNTRPARPVRGCPWKADGAHRPSWRPAAVRLPASSR